MKWFAKLPKVPNLVSYSNDKSTVAQVLSLTTIYIFTTKVGIDMMTPTVIIGALTNKRNDCDISALSYVSEEQTSWIGSLVYLFPPLGSAVVSAAQDRFGHRACMVFANAAHLVSVVVLAMAGSPAALYASSALMGFNVGFVTSFTVSYCGEVCEPRLRGTLTSVTNVFYFAGFLCVTALYAATADWRMSVSLTAVLPLLNAAVLFKTSDSPMWLLSKGRTEEAKRIFKKLRGNASEEKCSTEFQDMVHYVTEMNLNNQPKEETQKKSFKDLLFYFIEPETLKPLRMLMIFIFFSNVLSGIPYTPYLISIFEKFEAPFQPAWATTMYMAFGVTGNVFTIIYISRLGKRFLVLSTMITCSICYLSIGFIGHTLPSSPASSWMKIVLFFMSTFFSSMGVMPIVWTLMCEIFPMKSKNFGAGVSSATYFLLCFLMTKFYLDFEAMMGFYNTFLLFGVLGLIGLVYLYFELPETENKTLNEISEHFKSKRRSIKQEKTEK